MTKLTWIYLLIATASCASLHDSPPASPGKTFIKKSAHGQNLGKGLGNSPSLADYDKFFHEYWVSDSGAEKELLLPAKGSSWSTNGILEAVILLDIFKKLKNNINKNIAYNPAAGPVEPPSNKPLSLEISTLERNIDLAESITQNTFLHSPRIIKLVNFLLANTKNSQEFSLSIQTATGQIFEQWSAFAIPGMQPGLQQNMEKAYTPQNLEKHITTADILIGDSILAKAEQFAENSQFKDAIATVKKILKNDPFYLSAQERIKEYSNRAVRHLRKKAAQAYQNAIPAMDIATKQSYLKLAQNYLEKALELYPRSDNLATVKDNLDVITKNLSQIRPKENP